MEKQIKALGFQTSTTLSHFNEMRAFFVFLEVFLAAVGTVALVVAGLGIVNTLLMAVLERYQEIGICKAIGASDGRPGGAVSHRGGDHRTAGRPGRPDVGRLVSYGLEVAVSIYARHHGAVAPPDVFAFPALAAGRHRALRAGRERGGRASIRRYWPPGWIPFARCGGDERRRAGGGWAGKKEGRGRSRVGRRCTEEVVCRA